MTSTLGAVEVLKDQRSNLWYCGNIRELSGKNDILVGFESDVWSPAKYPASSVRKPPRMSGQELDRFQPRVGEEVELKVHATPHSPSAWGTATVKNIKHEFYIVCLTSGSGGPGPGEQIVEKDMLRPMSNRQGLTADCMDKDVFKLPAGLQSWMSTEDAIGCISHIEDQSGLLSIMLQESKCSLKLVGESKALVRAKMLLEVHVKHQAQIQNFQDVRDKRLKALETKRNRIEGSGFQHSIEFRVESSHVPRIIGKGGEAIRGVSEKYDVTVRILDGDNEDERLIRIFGNSKESVNEARSEIEFVEEVINVRPEQYSWILGRGGKTIQSFKENTGVFYARLDRDYKKLLLCGSRHSVDDATAMFETHLMYYPVFHQMDEEMEQIFAELEEYGDWDARWEWGVYRENEEWEKSQAKSKGSDGGGSGSGSGGKGKGGGHREKWERGSGYGNNTEQEERGGKGKGADRSDWKNSDRSAWTSKEEGSKQKAVGSWEQKETGIRLPRQKAETNESDNHGAKASGKANKAAKNGRSDESKQAPEEDDKVFKGGRAQAARGGEVVNKGEMAAMKRGKSGVREVADTSADTGERYVKKSGKMGSRV